MLDLNDVGRLLVAAALLPGCSGPEASMPGTETETETETATSEPGSTADTGETATGTTDPGGEDEGSDETTAADTSGGQAEDVDPSVFFEAIGGLWVAPVTSWTSAGSFPTMNMDVRAASQGVLFSRVDLDVDNSLRFAFAIEDHGGAPTLTYRNGGDFLGLQRDTRTVLESVEDDVWRFCALGGGCGYVDARFDFSQPGAMQLDVDVMGMRHIEWGAVRREDRELGGAFPSPPTLPGDADFPPMPTLEVQASWSEPLAADADVWVILSTTACGINPIANCVPSRYRKAQADAGSTSVTLTIPQIHAGSYRANAVLDRNRNIAAGILVPDTGDAVSFPLDATTTVPARGVGQLDLMLNTEL